MSKERFIAAKQQWAEKQKAKGVVPRSEPRAERLPPGQKLTTGFPVLDLGIHPEIPEADWRLTLDGLVEKPVTLDWKAFNALPQVEDVSDFHCVTTWSKYDNDWVGVPFADLQAMAEYLKSLPPNSSLRAGKPVPDESRQRGGVGAEQRLLRRRLVGAPRSKAHPHRQQRYRVPVVGHDGAVQSSHRTPFRRKGRRRQ